jgi:adenylate cyclase
MTDLPSDDDRLITLVDRLVLGGPPLYTREDVFERSGISEELSRAMWRALGFPDTGGARVFTESDLEALHVVRDLIDAGLVDDHVALTLARGLGQTTARLADWQVEALGRRLVDRGELSPGDRSVISDEEAQRLILAQTATLLPALQTLLTHVWRRQVAAVMERRLARADEAGAADVMTVVFADLVGFTRLARQLEDADLAIVVEGFESLSSDVVAASGSTLIKTVGDEVLFVADTARTAAQAVSELHKRAAASPDVPELRIGIATGPVLRRMGDVFGSTVNLASRLTALARPGTTLIDAATARELADDPHVQLRQTAPRRVRGVGVIRSFELSSL